MYPSMTNVLFQFCTLCVHNFLTVERLLHVEIIQRMVWLFKKMVLSSVKCPPDTGYADRPLSSGIKVSVWRSEALSRLM